MRDIPLYPIYNSTFSAYRVTPLYTGSTVLLDERSLTEYADRLSRTLRGELLDSISNSTVLYTRPVGALGILKTCSWDLLGDERTWRSQHQSEPNEDFDRTDLSAVQIEEEKVCGIHIRIEYDRGSYSALLLRDPRVEFDVPGFTFLPLLMVRMPADLRDIFLDFLSTTFDTRSTALKLSSSFLSSSLESILHTTGSKADGTSDALSSDLRLQLAFPQLGGSLRNIDVTIAEKDIGGFIARGHSIENSEAKGPFARALSQHLQQHLALDLFHSQVQLSKVVFGYFAISSDGKIKLFSPQTEETIRGSIHNSNAMLCSGEVDDFLAALCHEAVVPSAMSSKFTADPAVLRSHHGRAGSPQKSRSEAMLPQSSLDEESSEVSLARRKSRQDTTPIEPPPPYALYDPSLGDVT